MNEKTQQLKNLLRDLEAELAGLDTLDEETRSMLNEAVADIQARLVAQSETPASGQTHGRLRDAIEQFETSHPTLTGVLSRLVDTLGQMGI